MNFKIIFVIIGMVLLMAASVWPQDVCAQVEVCDQYGKRYRTPCELAKAQETNPCLKQTPCPDQ